MDQSITIERPGPSATPPGRPRADSGFRRVSRAVSHSVADFLGVSNETDMEKRHSRWENRRKRYAGSIAQLKDSYVTPEEDSDQTMTRRPSARKQSVAHMTLKGIGNLVSRKPQADAGCRITSPDENAPDPRHDTLERELRWGRVDPKTKRHMAIGVIGRYFRQSVNLPMFTSSVKQQIDDLDDHRPFFTYWVTFVQIVVFIVSISVYGLAPFGIGKVAITKIVKLSNMALESKAYSEYANIFVGPRQGDLIHLGAKYSPCMRVDVHLEQAIALDREEENQTACCVRNDGSGCVQRTRDECKTLSTWKKWGDPEINLTAPDGRVSGTVCGQDPSYCLKPASAAPFTWPDSIVDWPRCLETKKSNQTIGSRRDRHMSCEIVGRPCCHGIQGECFVTTHEHCDFVRGFFHPEAYLCAQVNCFEQICGMIPFAFPRRPDQFYRLWTSLFLHGGLFHLVVSLAFQMLIMRDMEKLTGAVRMGIIYIGSGIAGNLASATFLPYQVEAGPSGSQFGVMACLLVEVLQSYQMYKRPHIAIIKLVVPILVLFILGLLPWFDNWAHLFGFLFGFLLAFSIMPYVSFGVFDRKRKIISIVVALGAAIGLFFILVLIFYVAPLTDCAACSYFNCIPFTAELCDNMQVHLKKVSTYSKYY